ncbi:MAG: hypothetical protein QXG35_10115 [Nitrososphaerota archaeon]
MVGFYAGVSLVTPMTITSTVEVIKTQPVTLTTEILKSTTITKTAIAQLSYASKGSGMAILVTTSLTENIPAESLIKIMVVTSKGELVLQQNVVIKKTIDIYEFPLPTEQNEMICKGRPLFIDLTISTPVALYEYKGELKEWHGIETMCMPFK